MSTDTGRYRYFAYGSNMLLDRIRASDRAPSARVVATGYVCGRRLTFDKLGLDGSGKCHAETTGQETDRVYGAIFDVALAEKPALDRAESLGIGYEANAISVLTGNGAVEAQTYLAVRKRSSLGFHAEPAGWRWRDRGHSTR